MFDSSVVRVVSVLLVMAIVGFARYGIGRARIGNDEESREKAIKELQRAARKSAVIAGFIYMVAMVSVAGLFL